MDEKRGLQRGSELYYFKTLSLHNYESSEFDLQMLEYYLWK